MVLDEGNLWIQVGLEAALTPVRVPNLFFIQGGFCLCLTPVQASDRRGAHGLSLIAVLGCVLMDLGLTQRVQ